MLPFLVLTHTINITAITKLLVPRGQTNTTLPHRYISSYIYEARVSTFKLLILRGRAKTTRPHHSISSYIRSMCALQGFACVSIIDTHTYKPSPSSSSWFLRVLQVGLCRRPDNGHYLLSNGVRDPVHTWAIPTHSFVFMMASLSEKSTYDYYPLWISSCHRTRV